MPFVLGNIFQPLIDAFDAVIVFFHDSVGLGWGLSIIALTVAVRAALVPLTLKQFRSMQALQRLQPEIKGLQAKYKDDKQRLNQEMMKFYQENKVNPFSSCLPLLLQLPVFISLFYMLRKDLKEDICGDQLRAHGYTTVSEIQAHSCNAVAHGSAKFWFIPDLTAHATGAVLAVLIVLYVGSQLLSSVLMSVTADKNQRALMIALPFIFVTFVARFPAGLIVYWITTNLWTVAQQYLIRRGAGPIQPLGGTSPGPLARPVPARAAAAVGGGSGPDSSSAPRSGSGSGGSAPPPPPRRKKKQRSGRRR